MSLSSIQALPPELKVIIAGYLDLPSLAAFRKTSRTFSFIQPIPYQRDSQQYPLYALPHAIRKGNIQWMELALNALKPDLQFALQYTSLAATQGSEQMLQRFLETVLEFTSENEREAVIEEACFSTLKDYRRDPQLQILLSYLPNFSWLHIFSRKVQLHDEALRTALDELVSQSCHPVAQEYLHRATELVDTGPDFQIWRLLFQYMSRCNAPDQIRKLLEAIPPAPSASEQSSVYDDWQSAVYIASVNGYTTNFKALFGWGSLVVPSADYRQAWFFVLHWTCTDHREASIRELHSVAVESTLGPEWLPTVPLDLEEFRKQVDGNKLLKWEKFVRKGDHQ